jgi:hypothetical protein
MKVLAKAISKRCLNQSNAIKCSAVCCSDV